MASRNRSFVISSSMTVLAVSGTVRPSNRLEYFSIIVSVSSFSMPSSFLMTFICSCSMYFLCVDLTLSSTSLPILCCSLLSSNSFLSSLRLSMSRVGMSSSSSTRIRSSVSPPVSAAPRSLRYTGLSTTRCPNCSICWRLSR